MYTLGRDSKSHWVQIQDFPPKTLHTIILGEESGPLKQISMSVFNSQQMLPKPSLPKQPKKLTENFQNMVQQLQLAQGKFSAQSSYYRNLKTQLSQMHTFGIQQLKSKREAIVAQVDSIFQTIVQNFQNEWIQKQSLVKDKEIKIEDNMRRVQDQIDRIRLKMNEPQNRIVQSFQKLKEESEILINFNLNDLDFDQISLQQPQFSLSLVPDSENTLEVASKASVRNETNDEIIMDLIKGMNQSKVSKRRHHSNKRCEKKIYSELLQENKMISRKLSQLEQAVVSVSIPPKPCSQSSTRSSRKKAISSGSTTTQQAKIYIECQGKYSSYYKVSYYKDSRVKDLLQKICRILKKDPENYYLKDKKRKLESEEIVNSWPSAVFYLNKL